MSRFHCSLRSSLLEVMGAGKNGAREGDKRENRSFFAPITSKRLLRRL